MRLISSLLLVFALGCSEYDLSGAQKGELPPEDEDPEDLDDTDIPDDAETGALRGRICAPSGIWLSGAEVSGAGEVTTTGGGGRFELDGLPPGTHTFTAKKGLFEVTWDALIVENETTEMAEDECVSFEEEDLDIAVITGDYDEIERFLDLLGFTYDTYEGVNGNQWEQLVGNPSRMAQYDAIFINCNTVISPWSADWATYGGNIRNFVQNGGAVYASDYSYYFIESAFPQAIEFAGDDHSPHDAWGTGRPGDSFANVLDPNLVAALGSSQAHIEYDTSFVAVESANAEVLVEGTQPLMFGGSMVGPLVIRHNDPSGGAAVFTSFHNEAQLNDDMQRLVPEFIFSL